LAHNYSNLTETYSGTECLLGDAAKVTNPNYTDVALAGGMIDRIWIWQVGGVPISAIHNPANAWWIERELLGMTDYIISLNDRNFAGGLGIRPTYRGADGSWEPICTILETLHSKDISPHLMVYLLPEPDMIRQAAEALQEIIQVCAVTPRSIHLDLEGWWTNRNQTDREWGEAAIQQYFFTNWLAVTPALGIGITCVGSVPPTIRSALGIVDFAIPQFYAQYYGQPLQGHLVREHHYRAAEALGDAKQIVAGQTANPAHVSAPLMRDMLEIPCRSPIHSQGVSEKSLSGLTTSYCLTMQFAPILQR
jgi:hypothetical protein